jgi:hypothetical protein
LVDEKSSLVVSNIEIDTTDFDVYSRDFIRSAKVTIEDTVAFETWKNQMS